ncbi:hypothetical protein NLX83_06030 [Allokutzneria sp. A3M-2-11 16]|uniref:hypothetical protein n=1 Tax=Allokutzneria sp. A3M-2-11 16 TaxID=2962043 RepID=UPI0020B8FFE5|nr:hypothetical protein [Allokutzneria sp. A3M-2-11 16]MCP3798810.1 hypothetical protein [Allokutzneria sp. A3M-2-11 16]
MRDLVVAATLVTASMGLIGGHAAAAETAAGMEAPAPPHWIKHRSYFPWQHFACQVDGAGEIALGLAMDWKCVWTESENVYWLHLLVE